MIKALIPLAGLAIGVTSAGLAPVSSPSREEIFEIPQGTWARRMAGDQVEILPSQIRLTLGVRDVLVLQNHDDVPQIFGPTLMMPGQSFRLPFAVASSYQFVCTAHASGQMTILVEPFPDTPWARINWRLREFVGRISERSERNPPAATAATADYGLRPNPPYERHAPEQDEST